MIQFTLEISHCQIAVFDRGLTLPFNDWTEEHFDQGFVWRPRSVSFRTPTRAGVASIEIVQAEELTPHPDSLLTIAVPFEVKTTEIEIASIFSGQGVEVEPGDYELIFESSKSQPRPWVRLTMIPRKVTSARILKGAELLKVPAKLLMTANPA